MRKHPADMQLFRDLVANSHDIIAIISEDLKLMFLSDSVEKILGYRFDEVRGLLGADFLASEDVLAISDEFRKIAMDRDYVAMGEYRFRHRNGSFVLLEVIISNMLYHPHIGGYVVNARDVGFRKKIEKRIRDARKKLRASESKFKGLYQSISDGILETDLEGRVVHANHAYVSMLGYEKLDDIIGLHFNDFTPDKWHEWEDNIVKEKILKRGYSDLYKKEYVRRDGSIFPIDIKVWLIRENNKPTGMWAIVRDITESWMAEKRMEEANRQLKELNRYKTEEREKERKAIASVIHDELGQVLTAIKMEVCGLPYKSGCSGACMSEIQKISGKVSDAIKTVQRISGELRPGILDDLGLKAAIDWYARELRKRAGLQVDMDISISKISQDIDLALFRIVQEALTNVCRHARATQVNLWLARRDHAVELVIRDNGVGIPPKKLASGKSFGLIGMREKAEALDGLLDIRSDEKGTLLVVTIPVPQ